MNHYTLAEMTPGLSESFTVTVTEEMMAQFEAITGDVSPIHMDAEYAQKRGYPGRVVYGMLGASFFSTLAGAGPVGLSFVKLGKLFGLGQIDIVDMLPAKLEVARRMGADNGYTPAEISTPEFIAAANRSYDAVIDAVGLDVVVNSVLPLVKMGGDVCVYGVMTKNPTFDLSKAPYNFDLHMHQWPTRSEEKAAMTTLAQWIEEGRLSASDFITHRFAIEEIEEAFAAVKRGEVLKCVLTF